MNKILLDTHLLFWTIFESKKLSKEEIKLLKSPTSLIHVSIASLWELAIKKTIGKIDFPEVFFSKIEESEIIVLGIKNEHLTKSMELPLIHRDPFDRMLVAQSKVEGTKLITRDKNILKYLA